jgi:hypothetical protein
VPFPAIPDTRIAPQRFTGFVRRNQADGKLRHLPEKTRGYRDGSVAEACRVS